MKQYITLEQWNELSDGSKEKLTKYYFNHKEKWDGGSFVEIANEPRLFIRYWDIGKMIEYLGIGWPDVVVDEGRTPEELCDALWYAVKEILNK